MKIKKSIFAVGVVMLFLLISLTPSITAEKPEQKKKLSVMMQGVTDGDYSFEIDLSPQQLAQLNTDMDNFLQVVNSTKTEDSQEGINVTASEWENIKTSTNGFIDSLKTIAGDGFPADETKEFISDLIDFLTKPLYLIRQPLFSVGIGITWLPFYEYETFLGKMIRPIFIQYFLGISATFRLNPFIVGFTCIRFNLHRVRTFLFDGLMINFGELGVHRLVGPQLLIGYGCFTGFA